MQLQLQHCDPFVLIGLQLCRSSAFRKSISTRRTTAFAVRATRCEEANTSSCHHLPCTCRHELSACSRAGRSRHLVFETSSREQNSSSLRGTAGFSSCSRERHVCRSQKVHKQAVKDEQLLPITSDADVEASLAGQDDDQAIEAGVIPESRLYVEDPTSIVAQASTSGRQAGTAASAAVADRLLYPPAQRNQIRDSWCASSPPLTLHCKPGTADGGGRLRSSRAWTEVTHSPDALQETPDAMVQNLQKEWGAWRNCTGQSRQSCRVWRRLLWHRHGCCISSAEN